VGSILLDFLESPFLFHVQFVCKDGFEHHVVMTMSHVAPVLTEAFSNYMKWDVYHHQ